MTTLAELRAEFQRLGWHRRNERRVVLELAFHSTLAGAGLAMCYTSVGHPLWLAAGLVLATLGSVGIATNTHSSSHYATSDRRWVNELLTYLGYPFFLQLSATYWWHKHIVVHHAHPNVYGVDEDIDLAPWFVLTETDLARAGPLGRWYYRRQWILLPLAIAMIGFQMHVSGWRHIVAALRDPRRRRRSHVIDFAMMTLHVVTWILIPAQVIGTGDAISIYVMRIALMGPALFAVLAPAHFPAEAACVDPKALGGDFVLQQTLTTVDYRAGRIGRLFCSGLDYQIEHHLFPGVCHAYYPKMQPRVEAFCRLNHHPYRRLLWAEAIWKSVRAFARPKPVESIAAGPSASA
jgi:linoleoyl-CoA desaturase